MKGRSGSMTRRTALVVAIALFLVFPLAHAEPVLTIKNEDITIPNAMIMNPHVVNYSTRAKMSG